MHFSIYYVDVDQRKWAIGFYNLGYTFGVQLYTKVLTKILTNFWAYHYELCTLYRPLQAMIRNCISDDNPQFCAPEISYIKDWHYEWDSFVTFPHVIGQKLIRLTKYIFLLLRLEKLARIFMTCISINVWHVRHFIITLHLSYTSNYTLHLTAATTIKTD